ncbi:MAG: histidine phosphatase family protein [Eubacterium sp.]|nr:histidine phosphatase family protein [Eubacterium sp.]
MIRHGETDWNAARKVQGRVDIPLNDYGRQLAVWTAEGLRKEGIVFDRAYSSPLIRARETAEIILEGTGIVPVIDERIIEIDFGDFDGFSIPAVKEDAKYSRFARIFLDPSSYEPVNGESIQDLYDRARDFVENELYPQRSLDDTVLVAAHGAMIRGLLNVIDDVPIEAFWKKKQANCSVNRVHLDEDGFKIVYESKLFYEEKEPYVNPSEGNR